MSNLKAFIIKGDILGLPIYQYQTRTDAWPCILKEDQGVNKQ